MSATAPVRPMRIAMINSIRSYGGGEKRVLRSAYEFQRRGHPILIIARKGGELAHRAREQGFDVREFEYRKHTSPSLLREFAGWLREWKPDVVLGWNEHSIRAGCVAARFAGLPRRPLTIYYHGLEACFKNKAYNRYLVGPWTDLFVPNAEALAEELRSFGWIPSAKIHTIYDGVDPTAIDAADPTGVRESLEVKPDEVVGVVVARLVPEKGHAFLFEQLPPFVKRHPELRLWIAGEGPELERLTAQLKDLGLERCVQLLGFRDDIPRLLRAADLLVHPSRKEGAPNAVREGMVAGLAVVAVAASGTPELMVGGVTGLLSAIGDGPELAKNLEAVLSDADLRRRMGVAGRQRALTEFSEDTCAERWLALMAANRP